MPHDHGPDEKPHEHGGNCSSGCSHGGKPLGLAAHDDHDDHHDKSHHHGVCGHDHSDGSSFEHGHDEDSHHQHHHMHDKPENYNYGVLKTLFSKSGIDPDGWLECHRSKAVLGAAAALAAVEYQTTGATSMSSSLAMIFGTALVAHDASEDLMESAGQLNESHNISSGVVGMGVGAAHTASEGFLSVSSQMSGYEDIAVATVGIVGGYQGLSDFNIPATLQWATTEGKVQLSAFVGSAAAITAAVHPWSAKQLARADNFVAGLAEKRFEGVSNWLRNDGTKLSKVAAAPLLAGALTYYAANTLPVCHAHDEFMHCFDRNVEIQIDPSFD